MAIKTFLFSLKYPFSAKIVVKIKATAKMILIVIKVDLFLPVSSFTIESNIEHSISF